MLQSLIEFCTKFLLALRALFLLLFRRLRLQSFLKFSAKLLLAYLAMLLLFFAYGQYAEPRALLAAKSLCDGVKLGDSPESVVQKAKLAGASERYLSWVQSQSGERTIWVTFVGLPPFSRHICKVVATQVVTSAKYLYLD